MLANTGSDILPFAPVRATPDERCAAALEDIAMNFQRLVDFMAPAPAAKVGTKYVADRIGRTQTWVAQLARDEEIPGGCIAQGTGKGEKWTFFRDRIDKWIETRRRA